MTCSTSGRPPESHISTTQPTQAHRVVEPLLLRSMSANVPFDIGSLGLVREFVEHLVAKNASAFGNGGSSRQVLDWGGVEASVADSRTLEQAIGRAVVIADQMSRGLFAGIAQCDSPPSLKTEDPFFEFSMADVVPDFGDESRYRTKVVRKVARIFGARPAAV